MNGPREIARLAPALDPDHSWEGGRIQYDNGAMDGWLRANSDLFSIGYYERADRPFFNELATRYTTLDHCFCSILAETFPNRFFMHAGNVLLGVRVPVIIASP